MASIKDTVDTANNASNAAFDAINALDISTAKFQKSKRKGSIINSAKGNIFEFPVFISSSTPLDYAEATTSLLEQVYLSYLQMAVSINPVIDANTAKNGLQFADFKTDTNKYLECADTSYMVDACHAVYENAEYKTEFNLISIDDDVARIINESVDYQPLSEFNHYFQEADSSNPDDDQLNDLIKKLHDRENEIDKLKDQLDDALNSEKRRKDSAEADIAVRKNQIQDYDDTYMNDEQIIHRSSAKKTQHEAAIAEYREKIAKMEAAVKNSNYFNDDKKKMNADRKLAELKKDLANIEKNIKQSENYVTDEMRIHSANRKSAEAKSAIDEVNAKIMQDKQYAQAKKAELNEMLTKAEMLQFDQKMQEVNAAIGIADTAVNMGSRVVGTIDSHKKNKIEIEQLKKQLANYDEDHQRAIDKHDADLKKIDAEIQHYRQQDMSITAVKAPQAIKEGDIQKLNTMKPLLMNVALNVVDNNGSLSRPIEYIIGVKTHSRIVDAEILPEVAEYPLEEMNKLTRKAKWRAGELKFFKDIVFRIQQKKQTAVDSRDSRRKWYRRLYELAHLKGDAPATAVVSGKSLVGAFIKDKQGKGKLANGMIPNATMIITKADVDNIKMKTNIDLLKGSTATKFCNELFLIAIVVIDNDAESLKILLPDLDNDYEIHSLAAVQKQISMLDTSGTKTRDMFKLLG
jgi:predicted  nucleic acid-binding Zn-ribbon protein